MAVSLGVSDPGIIRHDCFCFSYPAPVRYRPNPCLIASEFSRTALLARLMKIGMATINSNSITRRVRLRRSLGRLMCWTLVGSGPSWLSIGFNFARLDRRRPGPLCGRASDERQGATDGMWGWLEPTVISGDNCHGT